MGFVISDWKTMQIIRVQLKNEGKIVVFTNGCFDLVHRGHVSFLTRARALGDVLIVGLNSDSSMARIKGKTRPLVNFIDRSAILSAFSAVDFVVPFDQKTPIEIISALVPDILVKGSDWEINNIVGREVVERAGGKVVRIPLIQGHSTTDLIQRVIERFSVKNKVKV